MEFEFDRLTNYSDADIVEEIKRVAAELDTSPLKKLEFDKKSRVHSSTIIRRFGGWKEGLAAAWRMPTR